MCGLEFELASPKEIAVVSPHPDTSSRTISHPSNVRDDVSPQPFSHREKGAGELLEVAFGEYRPNQVVAWKSEGDESVIPLLLEGREVINGKATAYVCRNFACQMPATETVALAAQLNG